jgi:uncharacterized protein
VRADEYDCQRCGACCADHGGLGGDGYAYLSPPESRRMRRLGLSVVNDGGAAFLGTRAGQGVSPVCVAFRGRVGSGCGCSVYADRPGVCRSFRVGEPLCLQARRDAGLPVSWHG